MHIVINAHNPCFCTEIYTCHMNYAFIVFLPNMNTKNATFLQMHFNSSWSGWKNNSIYDNRDYQIERWKTYYTSSCVFNTENWNYLCSSSSHYIPDSLLCIYIVCYLQETKTTEEVEVCTLRQKLNQFETRY